MSIQADLLRLLAPRAMRQQGATPADVAGSDFASLLEKARGGEISSGRGVTIAKGAKASLTGEQLERIAQAADKAEAQGATRALVMIDGAAYRLDLTMREITGAVDLSNGAVLTGVDAVIQIPATESGKKDAAVLPLPGRSAGMGNASLLKALSRSEGSEDQAAA